VDRDMVGFWAHKALGGIRGSWRWTRELAVASGECVWLRTATSREPDLPDNLAYQLFLCNHCVQLRNNTVRHEYL